MNEKDSVIQQMVGKNVKRIRLSKKLTQDELAKKCNLNQNYICRVELGKRNMTLNKIEAIANALDIEPKDLFKK